MGQRKIISTLVTFSTMGQQTKIFVLNLATSTPHVKGLREISSPLFNCSNYNIITERYVSISHLAIRLVCLRLDIRIQNEKQWNVLNTKNRSTPTAFVSGQIDFSIVYSVQKLFAVNIEKQQSTSANFKISRERSMPIRRKDFQKETSRVKRHKRLN